MIRIRRRLALLVAAGLAASACSPTYVLRAAWEEGKILNRRKPIARIVQDTATDWETRDKLLLVLQARQFAADSLRLNAGNSYTLFSRVESDTLVMVLSAAHKDRFQPYTWWFPIVGRVPYKGFFELEDALAAQRKLEAQGYDTYLRPSAAFSTLGWFNDPLLSTLLRYDRVSLANTVIHEIFHNTFFAPGQAVFNESLANFVGGRGAIEFFCRRDGPRSQTCETAHLPHGRTTCCSARSWRSWWRTSRRSTPARSFPRTTSCASASACLPTPSAALRTRCGRGCAWTPSPALRATR